MLRFSGTGRSWQQIPWLRDCRRHMTPGVWLSCCMFHGSCVHADGAWKSLASNNCSGWEYGGCGQKSSCPHLYSPHPVASPFPSPWFSLETSPSMALLTHGDQPPVIVSPLFCCFSVLQSLASRAGSWEPGTELLPTGTRTSPRVG